MRILIFLKGILTLIGSIIALTFPIILYLLVGLKSSISQYAYDPTPNLILMISLLLIAICLSVRKRLLITAILLILIGCIDVSHYKIIHNFIAILFFIDIIYIMFTCELKLYGIFMIINLITLMFSLYLFEINAIWLIVGFNAHIMYNILKKDYQKINGS